MSFERKLVRDVLKLQSRLTDHIGIEIEAEGTNLPRVEDGVWKSENDPSLRGESFEYVLRKPIPFNETKMALALMEEAWKSNEAVIKDSPNAGVHVHINCGDLTVTQLFNFLSLYLVVEDILVNTCGQHRIGNLFCLRACDAEYLVDMLGVAIKEQNLSVLHTDDLRYASVNVKALGDYGSLEFRAWRSDGDLGAIEWWCGLLQHLKGLAREIDNPTAVVYSVSDLRPEGFYKMILGKYAKDIPWEEKYELSVYDSIRRVQQFAYFGDW